MSTPNHGIESGADDGGRLPSGESVPADTGVREAFWNLIPASSGLKRGMRFPDGRRKAVAFNAHPDLGPVESPVEIDRGSGGERECSQSPDPVFQGDGREIEAPRYVQAKRGLRRRTSAMEGEHVCDGYPAFRTRWASPPALSAAKTFERYGRCAQNSVEQPTSYATQTQAGTSSKRRSSFRVASKSSMALDRRARCSGSHDPSKCTVSSTFGGVTDSSCGCGSGCESLRPVPVRRAPTGAVLTADP